MAFFMSSVIFPEARYPGGIAEITPQQLHEKASQVQIIDVRRPDEYTGELGHIAGARLLTLETHLKEALAQMPPDTPYVFVCRSGGRSGTATALAQSLGMTQAYNMQGGMILWNQLGLPIER